METLKAKMMMIKTPHRGFGHKTFTFPLGGGRNPQAFPEIEGLDAGKVRAANQRRSTRSSARTRKDNQKVGI